MFAKSSSAQSSAAACGRLVIIGVGLLSRLLTSVAARAGRGIRREGFYRVDEI
jgi:hypothetical protein